MSTAVEEKQLTWLVQRDGGGSAPGASSAELAEPGDELLLSVPALTPGLQLVRACLVLVFVVSFTLFIQLVVVSRLQASAAQGRGFDRLRSELANGTAPIGPVDDHGREFPAGTPLAFMKIPAIGLNQVIGEGTTASALFAGPGHRRDTVLPGQIGSSVVYGRRAAFGGPFSDIGELKAGDKIMVATGQGEFTYKVLGVRQEGDPAPPPLASGGSRLQLVTAGGTAFLPDGVVRVDADIVGTPVVGASRVVSTAGLSANERVMAGDTSTLWALALWLQALVALALGIVWAWHRLGRAQMWVVFLPTVLLVGLATSGEVARLLPNLL